MTPNPSPSQPAKADELYYGYTWGGVLQVAANGTPIMHKRRGDAMKHRHHPSKVVGLRVTIVTARSVSAPAKE